MAGHALARRVALSVTLCGLTRLFGSSLSKVLDLARAADDLGIDQIALPDHLAIGPHTDRYPYGRFPYPSEEPWLEPLTALAAIAGATRRIRLATSILIAPLRPALLLAKAAATLDVLSEGRLDLGVGLGWQREEFDACGVPFASRAARLDDTLRACRALWTGAPAAFASPSVAFRDLWCVPRPVQPGGIPIWWGVALSEANLARIVELGAGWMPISAGLEGLAGGIGRLRDGFAAAGRAPDSLGVQVTVRPVRSERGRIDLDRTLDSLPELGAAGVTVAAFPLDLFVASAEDLRPFLERLSRWAA